jgi:hypothetical protein
MSVKYNMQADTLGTLTTKTVTSHENLGQLVKDLFVAADDLNNRVNGMGRAAFDTFKASTDGVAHELNTALASVLEGVKGQDRSFKQGDAQIADDMHAAHSRANFPSARFHG